MRNPTPDQINCQRPGCSGHLFYVQPESALRAHCFHEQGRELRRCSCCGTTWTVTVAGPQECASSVPK